MIEAKLGIKTCDICGKTMRENQRVIVIADGRVQNQKDTLDFRGNAVQYACHAKCWEIQSSLERNL